jgi:hypothetical protein
VDTTYEIRCSEQGCDAFERPPLHLVEKPHDQTSQWLVGRAWRTETSERYLCPDHW